MSTRRFAALIFTLLGLFSLLTTHPALAQDDRPLIISLTYDGAVTSTLVPYLERGIRQAESRNAELVIFQLNTPGGSLDATQDIIELLLASQVPVVVYVAPQGAMAASAGTIITLAGHAAAMAPGTAIGAASPVSLTGGDIGETERAKLENFMKAQVRELAKNRGEEAMTLAEEAVTSARAASATEALDVGLVDFIAVDIHDLLRQLDGFEVQVAGRTETLKTSAALIDEINPSLIEQVLNAVTNPNIVFLLLNFGILAILLELSSPGGWVAGFLGVVCLAIALLGLGILPVNWFGLIFLGTAFVLFILDIKAPTHGALTIAGAASLIVGALVLFNSPGTPAEFRVSPLLIFAVSATTALGFGIFVAYAVRAQKAPLRMQPENLLPGKWAVVRSELKPVGTVQVGGELWTAEMEDGGEPIPQGARVQVIGVQGNRLLVRRLPGAESYASE